MKIIISPDKFKDTFSSREIADLISENIKKIYPEAEIIKIPSADGGEGTAEIIAPFFDARRIKTTVKNPVFKKISAAYFFSEKNKTAIIETAEASGLHLLPINRRNPLHTSSYGTGEIILNAVKKGAKTIYLTLGGSAVNDAGCGAAEATGYIFLDKNGKQIKNITGKDLVKIAEINDENIKINPGNIKIIALYDVKNKLYGKNGAAYVYAPQKGANKKETELLNKGLRNFSEIIQKKYGKKINDCKGCGAAGGLGAGSKVFFKAKLKSGTKTISKLLDFDKEINNADLIITGEGKFDLQSFEGKWTGNVLKKALKKQIPVAVICGISEYNKQSRRFKVIKLFEKFPGKEIAEKETPEKLKKYLDKNILKF